MALDGSDPSWPTLVPEMEIKFCCGETTVSSEIERHLARTEMLFWESGNKSQLCDTGLYDLRQAALSFFGLRFSI